MSNPTARVQILWNYCNLLRDDGLSYGGYVEQLTLLLFLKMADEVRVDAAISLQLARSHERGYGVGGSRG
jgi:type I restriction-modification system DNA methylase subunit